MNDFTGSNPSPAELTELSQVITALNLIRMNLGMYPTGHSRITESIDPAFDMIQHILRRKSELFIGFSGDEITFGETAPENIKKNAAFRDYSRSLNNLRIVSFTIHRGLKKEELLEFNRVLSAKASDIWALGKIESVFAGAGIKSIELKVIDADHFRLDEKKELVKPKEEIKLKDANFWIKLFERLELEAIKRNESEGILTDEVKIDPVEAIRFLNKEKEHWASAVFSYENMVSEFLSEIPKGGETGAEANKLLANANSIVADLHPELKKQLVEVVERQLTLHQDTGISEENLKSFPKDIFKEIIRQTSEKGSEISPALVNLLKKMAGSHEAQASPKSLKEQDFSSKDVETLLKREEYEKYVPEEYDKLLKKASGEFIPEAETDEKRFPINEHLKTFTHEHVDFEICQWIHSLMEGGITEEDYPACSEKLEHSVPELLKDGRFLFLADVIANLRRHAKGNTGELIRQKALSVLKSMSDRETVSRYTSPHILNSTGDPSEISQFLTSNGVHNLPWLFDLYLDPGTPMSANLTAILKSFGENASEEAVKRLPDQNSNAIIRLLTFFRAIKERSVSQTIKKLLSCHKEWAVRKELIITLIEFDDYAVPDMLKKSLKSVNKEEVMDAVVLSCIYRLGDMLQDLILMLKTVFIKGEDAALNEFIVGELAKTGDKSVIPVLEKIATQWFSFSPKHLTRMKIALYRNLNSFPKNQIQKLLKKGSGSRNNEIRKICAKILKSKE
jgi:hypothetical protein